jgi:hypothetical protein
VAGVGGGPVEVALQGGEAGAQVVEQLLAEHRADRDRLARLTWARIGSAYLVRQASALASTCSRAGRMPSADRRPSRTATAPRPPRRAARSPRVRGTAPGRPARTRGYRSPGRRARPAAALCRGTPGR